MNISLTGHHVELTDAIRNFAHDKFEKLNRHFERITKINVVFSVAKLIQTAEATVFVPGETLHAKAEAEDVYAAIDEVIAKLDRQLLKYKDKLTGH
jgi:putative sigma-54 modulation protein